MRQKKGLKEPWISRAALNLGLTCPVLIRGLRVFRGNFPIHAPLAFE